MKQQWNPPLSGTIDITIKANGDWYHEGVKFTRMPLAKLFSSILKKEGDDYFLLSPVEKWKISVEDVPFLVVDMEIIENPTDTRKHRIQFKTTTDDVFFLDADHPLRLLKQRHGEDVRPYVLVRDNLEAILHRNIFYRLAEMAEMHEGKQGVWSSDLFFPLE